MKTKTLFVLPDAASTASAATPDQKLSMPLNEAISVLTDVFQDQVMVRDKKINQLADIVFALNNKLKRFGEEYSSDEIMRILKTGRLPENCLSIKN